MTANTDQLPANVTSTNAGDLIFSPPSMQCMNDLAAVMCSGKATVPDHLKGNQADCLAIIMQAATWNMNPYMVGRCTHIVNGNLGYEAKLVNAVISSSTAIVGRFYYEYGGDWGNNDGQSTDAKRFVKVGARIKGETDIQWGEELYPASVTTKNSPLWKTNEKQQSSYLALKFWANLYTPAVMMGVHTSDELMDNPRPMEREINPAEPAKSALRRGDTEPESTDEEKTDEPKVVDAEITEDLVDLIPVEQIIHSMGNCTSMEKLNMARDYAAQYKKDSPERNKMVDKYNECRAVILRAEDEAKAKANETEGQGGDQ